MPDPTATEAVQILKRRITKGDNTAAAHTKLAMAYGSAGDAASALRHYRRAIQLDAKLLDAHLGAAQTLAELARPAEAANAIRDALALGPLVREIAKLTGAIRKLGTPELARALWTQSGAASVDPACVFSHAFLLMALDLYADSIAAFLRWAELRPLDPIANPSVPRPVTSPFTETQPSPRYGELAAQYKAMHTAAAQINADMFQGTDSFCILVGHIRDYVQRLGAKSLFDYGGGRGVQYTIGPVAWHGVTYANTAELLGLQSVYCYDVGVANAAPPPAKSDLVISVDMLEHIDRQDLPWIVRKLFSLATRGVFANVAAYPAAKKLPNGENAHCTVEKAPFWQQLFADVGAEFPGIDYCVIVAGGVSQRERSVLARP